MEQNSLTLQLDLPVEQYEPVKPYEDNKQTESDPASQADKLNGELPLSDETKPDLSTPEQKTDDIEVQKSHKHRRRKSAENKSNRNSITSTKMKSLKQIVDKAIEYNKTFTIFGRFPSVRDALKARGWIQNFEGLTHHRHSNRVQQNVNKDDDGSVGQDSDSGNQDNGEQDEQLISRLLRDTPVNFIWAMSDYIDWKYLNKATIVSRFPRVYFTTKVGLCNYLQQTHWFCEAGISNTLFPRCYTIASADDLITFIYDFRMTACISTLKILLNAIDNDEKEMFSEDGRVPLKVIEFAARRCSEYYSTQQHEDIDMKETEQVWDHQWDQFLTWYYQLAHEDALFESATENLRKSMYICSKMTMEMIEPHWPQMHLDGVTNLWIVKPGAKSRGRGIQVMRKLEDILSRLGTFHNNDSRYVVQKYIERPFLIHNTKFDIRQWFLVTSAYPLTIWMYKESYLRFCSQLFSLNNMHESVHLSNNAIQCKYKNALKRDQALPDENMWDCYTFQAYLRMIGRAEMWETVIYPGMKESITGTLLAAQEHMEHRKNCFELYGADFMLTDDLVPWLIEINSSPCMSPTTSVTARMCAQCLEDVIKVVVDRKNDRNADTGMFELIYKQHISPPQPYMGMNLTVRGTKIPNIQKPKKKQKHHGHDYSINSSSTKGIKGFIDDLSQELNKDSKFETKNMETQTKGDLIEKKESNELKVKEEEQDITDTSLAFTDYSSDEDSDDSDDDDDSAYCEISNDDSVKAEDNKNNNLNSNSNKTFSNLNNNISYNNNNNNNTSVKEHYETMALNLKLGEKSTMQAGDRKVTNTLLSTDKSIKDHIIRIRAIDKIANGNVPKYSKSDHIKMCRKHNDETKSDALIEWKCRVDKTRANYEELYLSKLNVLEEKKFQVRIHHGINWKAENGSVEEIMRKLKMPQKKEFLERLPLVRESVQKKLNNKGNKDKERTTNDSSTASSEKRILPQIKHKKHYKRASKNSIYAVGMSLTCQRSEKLLLPMGSEQCLGISLSSISNALASS